MEEQGTSVELCCKILNVSRSAYYRWLNGKVGIRTKENERIANLIEEIHTKSPDKGYRRIRDDLERYHGTKLNDKRVLRICRKINIKSTIKHFSKGCTRNAANPQYLAENLLNREFHACKPNEKWLTDITEFSIPAGKVYLSPIIDCFDGLPVSWSIGTSPNAELANGMLDSAIATLINGEKPIVHTDRGCHYRWPGWISRMDAAGLIRSMSNKGCSPDNSACEGFFGRLKNEMFYGRDWSNVTINQFIEKLNKYIVWYGEKRIKLSLGGLSPMEYRRSLGLV